MAALQAMIADVSSGSQGLFVLLALVALLIYGLSVGKTRAIVSLLSAFVAYPLAAFFPLTSWLQGNIPFTAGTWAIPVALFFVFYIATFLVLSHSVVKNRFTLGEVSVWKIFLISIVQLGLLSSMAISLLPVELSTSAFGPVHPYLAGHTALWAWAFLSVAIVPLLKSS